MTSQIAIRNSLALSLQRHPCSVLFFSRPRSEDRPHRGRTFSIYLCPKTSPQDALFPAGPPTCTYSAFILRLLLAVVRVYKLRSSLMHGFTDDARCSYDRRRGPPRRPELHGQRRHAVGLLVTATTCGRNHVRHQLCKQASKQSIRSRSDVTS